MKSTVFNQTILEQIKPECDMLYLRVKQAKEDQHKTNQDIADATGIPLSSVGKFLSDTLERPCVYPVAAACIYLGLSLDSLLGINSNNAEKAEEDSDRVAALEAENRELKLHLDYAQKDIGHLEEAVKNRRKVIYTLIGLCGLMALFLCLSLKGLISHV